MSKLKPPGFNTLSITVLAIIWASLTTIADGDSKIFDLGDFAFESGKVLPNAKLSYVTHGALNSDKSNVILATSFYSGDHHGYNLRISYSISQLQDT